MYRIQNSGLNPHATVLFSLTPALANKMQLFSYIALPLKYIRGLILELCRNFPIGQTIVVNGTKRANPSPATKEGKDQESIQSSITPDPGYESESDHHYILTSQTRAKRSAP